ncbi:MAG: ribulose-phosphate 3-epimerase [Clostridiales bacterium]|jgi:ribulose-phosphate 3-epimerase|nr:ribulose-phosphate 3-epimerase [Clostridiales bacterium]
MFKLAPSILAADFTQLGYQIKQIEESGAHYLHIDVMDGLFVPNISLGQPVIKSIRKATDMTFDVHLMIDSPDRYIEEFANAGADIINVHVEAVPDIDASIRKIKSCNKRAAITVKPNTDIEVVYPFLGLVDMVLIMSVEPGFGGQKLIPGALKKAEKLAGHITNNNLFTEIEMDGGINMENIKDVLNAGVNVAVVGSAIFGSSDIKKSVRDFYNAIAESQ